MDLNTVTAADEAGIVARDVAANGVMSATQFNTITTALAALTPPVALTAPELLAFLVACADQGTSSAGSIAGDTGGAAPVQYATLVNTIRRTCTLRQFCMRFAKHVWNFYVRNNRLPANWSRFGFNRAQARAGFDFFNGVNHTHAETPVVGVLQPPTDDEIRAANANAYIRINQARPTGVTTLGATTTAQQGVSGMRPQIGFGP